MEVSEYLAKEMFASFGRAYYHSEVMCRGLAIFYAFRISQQNTGITKPSIEEKMAEAFSLTLGLVIAKVKPLVSIELQILLDNALEKRNFLAHAFWYERAHLMMKDDTVRELIIELGSYEDLFVLIDGKISALVKNIFAELGVSSNLWEQQIYPLHPVDEIPLIKPMGKAMIRIIHAYDVSSEHGQTLVFITEEREFLQLSDMGFSRSTFNEIGENWIPNPLLGPYLPANIAPRPKITEPWNYEIKLPKNAVMWVKKKKTESRFRWGIKSVKR